MEKSKLSVQKSDVGIKGRWENGNGGDKKKKRFFDPVDTQKQNPSLKKKGLKKKLRLKHGWGGGGTPPRAQTGETEPGGKKCRR